MKLQLYRMSLLYEVLSIVMVLLVIASCDDFLAEKPRDVVSPSNYFNSDKEANTAVTGLYFQFTNNHYGGLMGPSGLKKYYWLGADEMYSVRKSKHFGPMQNYTINAGYGELLKVWGPLYTIIQDANLDISKIEGNKKLSEEGRNKALGQALFIRAFCYYHLTNLWGDVPYYRNNLSLSEAQSLGRTDKTKIRQEIAEDLKRAATILPSIYPESENGRATKWAAKTLLAHVDLWLKDWQGARDAAVDVIKNSPHRLLDNYADIFKLSNEYNDEIIFQFIQDRDLKPQSITDAFNPHTYGVGEPKNPENAEALSDSLMAHGLGLTGYNQYCMLPNFYNSWPDDDLRKDASAATSLFGIEFNYIYFPKMWDLDVTASPRNTHDDNNIIFRLADDYLMAAEAENELNGPANAYQYINKVRERAFDPDQPLSGLTQEQFREAIHKERAWELGAEGFRRLDLIRWGILVETVKNTNYPVYDGPSNIQSYHTLLPIPAQELERNPNLTQNPGYGGQ